MDVLNGHSFPANHSSGGRRDRNLHFGQLISWWPCWNRATRKKCFSSTCGLLIIGIKLNPPFMADNPVNIIQDRTRRQRPRGKNRASEGGGVVSTPGIKQLSLCFHGDLWTLAKLINYQLSWGHWLDSSCCYLQNVLVVNILTEMFPLSRDYLLDDNIL